MVAHCVPKVEMVPIGASQETDQPDRVHEVLDPR